MKHITTPLTFLICFFLFIECTSTSSTILEEQADQQIKEAKEIDSETDKETMHIDGRFLYTMAGEKVIIRGVNEMMIWSDDQSGESILPEIAKTGANSVRLVWLTTGDLVELDKLIANSIRNGMIPMIEMHDATGDWSKLPTVLDFWLQDDVKALVDKYKKWVLLNIANEVGPNGGDEIFLRNYKDAITKLRDKGYKVPLIIDSSDWGKDEGIIARNWKELLNYDPLKNTMFSVHTYWVDNSKIRMDNFLNLVVSDGIPFLFGEGPQPNGYDCNTTFPYIDGMKQCQEKEIGWLSWSWGTVNNGDCEQPNGESKYNITSDGLYGNWNNDWGRLTMVDDDNSIQNTSVRPKSLLNDANTF
ncbi:mannan endo-1,4-beta-mannosidase [Saonia flava]|uniref:Mannan endo-1,4-beta-mannosidase n=1 Tax=Saonia flava TaxID=523696 RepID=A0A846QZM0_9FLAO|nr:cellulase family glycosylhydrolase [Saonia flava]NJB72102.1 mannan endo-1,4-beta-mannosidase [Saonia flava]